MKPNVTLPVTQKAWLTNSALAPHMDVFIGHLQHGRYAVNTSRVYVAGIAHFAYWPELSRASPSMWNAWIIEAR